MSEYIEREALLKETESRIMWGMSAQAIYEAIQDAPTADVVPAVLLESPEIDAVPVVMCKECEYWGDEDGFIKNGDGITHARCRVHNYVIDGRHTGWCPKEDDFCSYGERKEGAE